MQFIDSIFSYAQMPYCLSLKYQKNVSPSGVTRSFNNYWKGFHNFTEKPASQDIPFISPLFMTLTYNTKLDSNSPPAKGGKAGKKMLDHPLFRRKSFFSMTPAPQLGKRGAHSDCDRVFARHWPVRPITAVQ